VLARLDPGGVGHVLCPLPEQGRNEMVLVRLRRIDLSLQGGVSHRGILGAGVAPE
jgi:hypothetical protein